MTNTVLHPSSKGSTPTRSVDSEVADLAGQGQAGSPEEVSVVSKTSVNSSAELEDVVVASPWRICLGHSPVEVVDHEQAQIFEARISNHPSM